MKITTPRKENAITTDQVEFATQDYRPIEGDSSID